MSDLVKHSLTVMNRIAEFIQDLSEEDLAQLANNQARLAIIPWGQDQPRVPASRVRPTAKAAAADPDEVIAAAQALTDQGELERYLAPMLLATLKAVAAKRDVALTGRDKKADIVDKLVYNLVGYREGRPSLIEEIEACQERMGEIEKAAGRAQLTWNLGNHDSRFETRLATVAPEYARLHGVHLKDHFKAWSPAWSTWVNDVVIKHRFKGGIHAPTNNTLWAGKSIVTGHLHSAKVQPVTDYNGTRYGVDTGCMADTDGKQFVDYSEDNPKNWRSGFVVLTFKNGRLLQPELVLVWDKTHVEFRGEIIKV